MTKATAITVTYQQFAEGVGRTDRMTLEASLAWHKAYVKLDAEKQSEWKYDFVLNYVIGRMDCSRDQAVVICGKTRVQRTAKQEQAVNAGGKKFSFHISRTEKSDGKKPAVAVPKQLVSNIVAEIIDAGLTKAQFDALLAQLRDSVSFQ
jgi:uncharacterized lipoprotein YmbA